MTTRSLSKKIKPLDELAGICRDLKAKGRRTVHCHGVFDLIHPGHIRHFEAAKQQGDVLVVTLTKDEHVGKGPGRPVFNQRLRAETLAALQCVDYVAVNKWPTAVETIGLLRPDVYVKGSDYARPEQDLTGKIRDEQAAVEAVGGRLHFTDEITFSSTELLNAYFEVYPEPAEAFLREFRTRYGVEEVLHRFAELKRLRVLVVGDTIIDEYHYCQAMGKSPKELLVTTRYLREEAFAGGVLACANHVAGFCDRVDLVTCLGRQETREEFIRHHLRSNISPTFFFREDTPTIVKRRYVEPAFLSKMFEVCFLDDRPLPAPLEYEVAEHLRRILPEYDLVVVADYGHGFLSSTLVQAVAESARFLVVNTQTNSANTGYNLIIKWPRADYVCIDEPEVRLAFRDRFGPLPELVEAVVKVLGSRMVTITRGHLGSLTYRPDSGSYETPVFSREIVDRVGAGDAYLAVTAPCVAAGWPADLVGFVGNAVGALAVRIVGNRSPVEPVTLYKFITALLK